MKCLSLKQPFAELLAVGRKTVEVRNWNTNFRGEFLIHASKGIDRSACKEHGMDPEKLSIGAVIGKARIVAVKKYMSRKGFMAERHRHLAGWGYYTGRAHGFTISNPEKFDKPIPLSGRLNFFDADIE